MKDTSVLLSASFLSVTNNYAMTFVILGQWDKLSAKKRYGKWPPTPIPIGQPPFSLGFSQALSLSLFPTPPTTHPARQEGGKEFSSF